MNYQINNNFKIFGRPINVLWAGWKSTTTLLQRTGWQVSAEQNIYENSIRIVIKHPNYNIYGISNLMKMDYFNFKMDDINDFNFEIKCMASRFEIRTIDDFSNFKPVDCEPSFINGCEVKSIEDFNIFRPIKNTQDLIVEPKEVNELMELILSKQSDKQREIRKKKALEWRKSVRKDMSLKAMYEQEINPANDIVAQIVVAA